MKITLTAPKQVVIREAQIKTINEITINRMIDSPQDKKIFIFSNELGQIILWEGAAYDAIGQWTDQDVINRLNQLYS